MTALTQSLRWDTLARLGFEAGLAAAFCALYVYALG